MMPEEKLLENVSLWYRKVKEKRKIENVSENLTTPAQPRMHTDSHGYNQTKKENQLCDFGDKA
jgi:hypothetical protein